MAVGGLGVRRCPSHPFCAQIGDHHMSEIKIPTTPPPTPPQMAAEYSGTFGEGGEIELVTAEEAAALLKLDVSTVYRLLRSGEIQAVRIGRSVRIRRGELVRFVDRHSGY